jgi:hypothetical protein
MVTKEVIGTACLSLWPLILIAFAFLTAPGFVIPFFNNPIARLAGLGALVWLLLGFFVMHKYSKWWQRSIAMLIFPLPVALFPMLGPAIVTIISALQNM